MPSRGGGVPSRGGGAGGKLHSLSHFRLEPLLFAELGARGKGGAAARNLADELFAHNPPVLKLANGANCQALCCVVVREFAVVVGYTRSVFGCGA